MIKNNSFTQLISWKKAHLLTLEIYKLTRIFPQSEQYGLSSQLRRASSSISSNIAEGYGRPGVKEKIRFYSIAEGSLIEVQNHLILSKDIQYIDNNTFSLIYDLSVEVHKLIRGSVRTLKTKIDSIPQP